MRQVQSQHKVDIEIIEPRHSEEIDKIQNEFRGADLLN